MEYTDQCWVCAGQRTVKKATGKSIPCGECKGTGELTYGEPDEQENFKGKRRR